MTVGVISLLVTLFAAYWTNRSSLEIKKSFRTKFIGQFPSHFKEVLNLMKDSSGEIIIVVDIAGYACLSEPDYFDDFRYLIESKITKGIHITLITHSDDLQKELLRKQLKNYEVDFKSLKKIDKRKLNRFTSKYNLTVKNIEQLIEAIMDRNKDVEDIFRRLNRNEWIFKVNKSMDLFYWIFENKGEAIFTFHSFNEKESNGKHFTEIAFRTTDYNLVMHLQFRTELLKNEIELP